jgi:hypothetical protein
MNCNKKSKSPRKRRKIKRRIEKRLNFNNWILNKIKNKIKVDQGDHWTTRENFLKNLIDHRYKEFKNKEAQDQNNQEGSNTELNSMIETTEINRMIEIDSMTDLSPMIETDSLMETTQEITDTKETVHLKNMGQKTIGTKITKIESKEGQWETEKSHLGIGMRIKDSIIKKDNTKVSIKGIGINRIRNLMGNQIV